jgi:hypothetical protein
MQAYIQTAFQKPRFHVGIENGSISQNLNIGIFQDHNSYLHTLRLNMRPELNGTVVVLASKAIRFLISVNVSDFTKTLLYI